MPRRWSIFLALALPMVGLLLWATRDAPLEPMQRGFLVAAIVATAAASAWIISLIE